MKQPARMHHPEVFELSKRYSPPRIDLRRARIIDHYGDEESAPRPINHRVPTDVTQEDLEFYFNVWIFIKLEDLLFYLYPVADLNEKYTRKDSDRYVYNNDYIDNYLHVIEFRLRDPQTRLQPSDREGLIEGLNWIKESVHPDEDWSHFPAIRRMIGLGD